MFFMISPALIVLHSTLLSLVNKRGGQVFLAAQGSGRAGLSAIGIPAWKEGRACAAVDNNINGVTV
jgi:hypothetical protein